MRRRKTASFVPTSSEEAIELLAEYVALERQALRARLGAEVMIDQLKASRDAELARLQGDLDSRFASLKAWWEGGGRELAKDKRSAELAGAKIGIRLAPPKVKLARGLKLEAVVAWLRGLRWTRAKEFLRVKTELDKQALIKAYPADEGVRRVFEPKGVTVVQEDEFFIDAELDEDAIRSSLEESAK